MKKIHVAIYERGVIHDDLDLLMKDFDWKPFLRQLSSMNLPVKTITSHIESIQGMSFIAATGGKVSPKDMGIFATVFSTAEFRTDQSLVRTNTKNEPYWWATWALIYRTKVGSPQYAQLLVSAFNFTTKTWDFKLA